LRVVDAEGGEGGGREKREAMSVNEGLALQCAPKGGKEGKAILFLHHFHSCMPRASRRPRLREEGKRGRKPSPISTSLANYFIADQMTSRRSGEKKQSQGKKKKKSSLSNSRSAKVAERTRVAAVAVVGPTPKKSSVCYFLSLSQARGGGGKGKKAFSFLYVCYPRQRKRGGKGGLLFWCGRGKRKGGGRGGKCFRPPHPFLRG